MGEPDVLRCRPLLDDGCECSAFGPIRRDFGVKGGEHGRQARGLDTSSSSPTLPVIDGGTSRVGLVGALPDTGEHDEAAQVIAEAADCWERLYQDDRELGIMVFGTWGRLLTRTSEPGSARPHLQTALRLAEEAGKQSEVAITLLHLGNADLAENKIDGAREHFESGLAIAAAIPNAHHLRASIMQNLCSIDLQTSRPADAHALATEALAELAHLPESEFSVIAALLHFTRAQADLSSGGDLKTIVSEAGAALDD